MGTPPSRATLLKLLNPSKSIRLLRLQKCLQLPYGRQPASLGPALLPAIPVTLAFRWMGSLLLFLMGFPKGSRWKRTNLPSPWCPLPVSTEGNSCSVLGIRCVLLRGFYSPPPLGCDYCLSSLCCWENRPLWGTDEDFRSCGALPEVMQEACGGIASLTLAVRQSG